MAKRYPNRRPSDYLDLDEWTGFQLDTALAVKYDLEEKEFILELHDSILEYLVNVMRSMGAKAKKPPRKKLLEQMKEESELPHISSVLAGIGMGKAGIIVERTKK